MADNYQDALIKAIETISKSQVDNLATDKTVTATIISCSNLLTNEYKVSYNGGIMYVYGSEGKTYTENSSVYVLVPEGDFTKKKIIIESATYKENDQNISFISSIMNDYNLLGKNTLYEQNNYKVYPAGLNSYLTQDRLLIYQRGIEPSAENGNLLFLDAESLNTYMQQSDALMVEAKFKTNLPKEHRVRGKYWLNIIIATKDGNKTFNEFENCLPNNIKISKEENLQNKKALDSLQQLWQVENETSEALSNAIEKTTELKNLYNNRIKENKDEDDSRTKQALTDIVILLQDLINIKTGGMIAQSKEIFEKMWSSKYEVPQVKYQTFTLSSDKMTGDPHRFYNWANQYIFCPINTSNFLYIESIVFQSYDFVDNDNIPMATLKGDDIFVQNIEIYGVKKISATNGDFKLQIGTPQGAIFHSYNKATDGLEILGKVTKANVDITSNTNFYWFVEDVSITSESSFFNYYAGAGWRWLQATKGNKERISVLLEDCTSFENHYKCVAVYKQEVVLKADVTIYNNASKRKVEIQSNIGTSFSFDRGIPILTCYVNDRAENFEAGEENPHDDKLYKFIWSVTEDAKEVITYNKTDEELENEYNELKDKLEKGEFEGSDEEEKQISKKTLIKKIEDVQQQRKNLQIENLRIDKNIFQYPISSINNVANIKCGVYLKDTEDSEYYCVGTANIDLQNNSEATPTEYYILITNGDQVFQYSESGVAPNNERYTDPLEVKPLECHFYDPTGLEVNENTYELKWKVPLSDSMIVTPIQNMTENPATGNKELNISPKKEWYQGRVFPLEIQQSYNYFALNNQVTAIVTYDGREYTQDSKLYFTKIGDNGTNGTDIVCKIEPKNDIGNSGMLALEFKDNKITWNTGEEINVSAPLEAKAYNRGSRLAIEEGRVKWSIAGGGVPKEGDTPGELIVTRSEHLYFPERSSGIIGWLKNNNSTSTKFNNQIVKAEISIKDEVTNNYNNYYSYYPIYTIYYNSDTIKNIYIDKTKTLKYITYNSDGRNPLFNKNQGINIKIDGDINADYFIEWTVHGGINDIVNDGSSSTSSLKLYQYKEGIYYEDGEKKQETASLKILQEALEEQKNKQVKEYEIYVSPVDVYSGEYCNNLIRARIYSSKDNYNSANPVVLAEIHIPICLTLNTYGLSSLNAWDGTHIEINEDENYILAPQIGAGYKDSENKFTGIVMGKATTYDKVNSSGNAIDDTSTGLLGYSGGKQSIWLDAESGKAVFGLPELQASQENEYNEGRIELVPGGVSSIANWRIGSRLLYNIIDSSMKEENTIDKAYRDDHAPAGSKYSISPKGSGIILSSKPSYISIKSQQIILQKNQNTGYGEMTQGSKNTIFAYNDPTAKNCTNANLITSGKSELYNGDSLELQLDPNQRTLFGIFLHHKERNSEGYLVNASGKQIATEYDKFIINAETGKYYTEEDVDWQRTLKVYIDSYGRFVTNALKESAIGLAPGFVEAFGQPVKNHSYSGLTLESGEDDGRADTICKIFTKTNPSYDDSLYISGAQNGSSNEYTRPIGIYGSVISLYGNGSNSSNISTSSDNYLQMNGEDSICKIQVTGRGEKSSYSFGIDCKQDISGANSIIVGDDYTLESKNGNISNTAKENITNIAKKGSISSTAGGSISLINSFESASSHGSSLTLSGYSGALVSNNSNYIQISNGNTQIRNSYKINIDAYAENGSKISSIGLGQTGAYIESTKYIQIYCPHSDISISNYNNTILVSSNEGTAYGSLWAPSGGIQMTGNVYCTNFLTSGGGLKTEGDISTERDCHVKNNMLCKNIYWNDGSTIGGSDSVWQELMYMLNIYNSHTHTTRVHVPGRYTTQNVSVIIGGKEDQNNLQWVTVGNWNENGIWEVIDSGYIQDPITVTKTVDLSIEAQDITVTLESPDPQMEYNEYRVKRIK